jgi:hypothetical protein
VSGIIDINGILAAVDSAWAEEVKEIDMAMVEAISDERHRWPNQTLRQNGEIAGSPRDIVDTGGMLGSQYKNTIMPGEVKFGWTEDNPELNHNGGMSTYNGHRYYHTPRPWTQHAISGDADAPLEYQRGDAILNVPEDFARKLANYLETDAD